MDKSAGCGVTQSGGAYPIGLSYHFEEFLAVRSTPYEVHVQPNLPFNNNKIAQHYRVTLHGTNINRILHFTSRAIGSFGTDFGMIWLDQS